MSFSEAVVWLLPGGVAVYVLISVFVSRVRHVRRHRAKFHAIADDVTVSKANVGERDQAPRHDPPRVDGPHKSVTGAGRSTPRALRARHVPRSAS
ncbi:hypothetical protein GCM10025762_07300 [Haloechinothrix salitolerans]